MHGTRNLEEFNKKLKSVTTKLLEEMVGVEKSVVIQSLIVTENSTDDNLGTNFKIVIQATHTKLAQRETP